MNGKLDEAFTEEFSSKSKLKLKISSLIKNPFVVILAVIIFLYIFHPTIFNLGFYLGKGEAPVPMNYVSNFYLWTRHNKNDAQKIVVGSGEELSQTYFQNRKTYVIVHGFTRHGLDQWIISMKDALLWREDCNVISADWQAGSMTVGYYVIQARIAAVGEDISKLAIFLRSASNLNFRNVHLIGHSLGAHIVGFVGKYLNSSVPRITGLDPAGLGFSGTPPTIRLDKSDAPFVDVIHSHGCYALINQWTDCYGTHENLGHADFWPNGGEDQPACSEFGDGIKAVRNGSNCNHGMAYVYYTSSIYFYSTSTRFLARKCPSWELFNNESCPCDDQSVQYMGYNANPRSHGVFYLNTSHIQPYGLLEPHCSAGEHSIFKIIGILICGSLTMLWLISNALWMMSLYLNRDLSLCLERWIAEKTPNSSRFSIVKCPKTRKD